MPPLQKSHNPGSSSDSPITWQHRGSFVLLPIIFHTMPGSQHLGETLRRCSGLHHYIWYPGGGVKGDNLSHQHWIMVNRLLGRVGCFKPSIKKWDFCDSSACECGEPEQTDDHVINNCALYSPTGGEAVLFNVSPDMNAWLNNTELVI